jgi:hypothetical protein
MKKIILLGMFVIGFSLMATAQTESPVQEAPVKSCCKSKTAAATETKSCCKSKTASTTETKSCCKSKTAMAESKSCDHKEGKKAECSKPSSNKTSSKAAAKASAKAKA